MTREGPSCPSHHLLCLAPWPLQSSRGHAQIIRTFHCSPGSLPQLPWGSQGHCGHLGPPSMTALQGIIPAMPSAGVQGTLTPTFLSRPAIIPSFCPSLQPLGKHSSQNSRIGPGDWELHAAWGGSRVPACASTDPRTLGWPLHPFLSLSFQAVRMGPALSSQRSPFHPTTGHKSLEVRWYCQVFSNKHIFLL